MSLQNLPKIKGYLISTYGSIQWHSINCNLFISVTRISSVTLPVQLNSSLADLVEIFPEVGVKNREQGVMCMKGIQQTK